MPVKLSKRIKQECRDKIEVQIDWGVAPEPEEYGIDASSVTITDNRCLSKRRNSERYFERGRLVEPRPSENLQNPRSLNDEKPNNDYSPDRDKQAVP